MAQEDAAAAPAPIGESAPELPPQRGPETLAPPQVPAQRPDADGPLGQPEPVGTEEQAPGPDEVERDPEGGPEPAPTSEGADGPGAPAAATLGARERAVLDFERRRWRHTGAKEQAIRDAFDFSATRYYQILTALLDDPAALAYAPALVGRLRRIRDARQQARR